MYNFDSSWHGISMNWDSSIIETEIDDTRSNLQHTFWIMAHFLDTLSNFLTIQKNDSFLQ